jgi:carbonic anhydrase
VPHVDGYLVANAAHAARLAASSERLPLVPAQHVAVIACMDSRLDIFSSLGLARGDAHVIRNAGGVVTPDVIRSLAMSQRLMQTTEIVLVHHTDCGLSKRNHEDLSDALRGEDGEPYDGPTFVFTDPRESVKISAETLRSSPFIPHTSNIRGFVYDVQTGLLHEVEL